jgi:DNA polymerase III delta subunit
LVAAKGKTIHSARAKREVEVKKPKPYDDGAEYVRWILKEGERLNIDLSMIAVALFWNCGTDLRKICSEITKIKVLVGPGGTAEPSLARRVMCFSAELTPKHVIDAVCEGHPAKAIAFYDRLQEGGCETGWIIAYMQRHAIQQLRAELLLKSGHTVEQVAAAFGSHPAFVRSNILPKLGLWSISSLRFSLDTLCSLDLKHKRGTDVSRWGLEPEIIRLSEEAKHNVTSRRS